MASKEESSGARGSTESAPEPGVAKSEGSAPNESEPGQEEVSQLSKMAAGMNMVMGRLASDPMGYQMARRHMEAERTKKPHKGEDEESVFGNESEFPAPASIRLPPDDYEFPTALPESGPRDRFLDIQRPFEYDGSPNTWDEWKVDMQYYVETQRRRFKSKKEVVIVVMGCLKPGTHIRATMKALAKTLMDPHSEENHAFMNKDGPMEGAQWILDYLKGHINLLAHKERQHGRLYKAQGNTPFHIWIKEIDMARLELGIPTKELLRFVVNNMSKDDRYEICQWLRIRPEQLSWHDLRHDGIDITFQYWERNRAHHPWRGGRNENNAMQPRDSHGHFTARGHAGQSQDAPGTRDPRPRLSDDDFNLLRAAKACFRCRRTGHRKEACDNEPDFKSTLTDAAREHLKKVAKQIIEARVARHATGQDYE